MLRIAIGLVGAFLVSVTAHAASDLPASATHAEAAPKCATATETDCFQNAPDPYAIIGLPHAIACPGVTVRLFLERSVYKPQSGLTAVAVGKVEFKGKTEVGLFAKQGTPSFVKSKSVYFYVTEYGWSLIIGGTEICGDSKGGELAKRLPMGVLK